MKHMLKIKNIYNKMNDEHKTALETSVDSYYNTILNDLTLFMEHPKNAGCNNFTYKLVYPSTINISFSSLYESIIEKLKREGFLVDIIKPHRYTNDDKYKIDLKLSGWANEEE